MDTYTTLDDLNLCNDSRSKIVCMGMFDGVHIGHRALIARACEKAAARRGMAVAFSFQNHPLSHLAPAYAPPLLTPWPRKVRIFQELGLDAAVVVPFSDYLMGLSPEEFVRDVLIAKCDAAVAACGYNFRFGRDAAGTPDLLTQLMADEGRETIILPKVKVQDVTVSSTLIRDLIGERRIDEAPKYMGDSFRLDGRVVTGQGRGAAIGFPTANLQVHPDVLVPPSGVYAVRVFLNGESWPGMMNIGRRPTFEENGEKTIEVHVIGFTGELTGRTLEVAFLAHLRPERKFDSPEALVGQLQRDRAKALALIKREHKSPDRARKQG